MSIIERELLERISKLSSEQQRQVLEFVRALARPVGEPVENILRHAREINFPRPDLEEMEHIINEQFEQIDWDDWNNITASPE